MQQKPALFYLACICGALLLLTFWTSGQTQTVTSVVPEYSKDGSKLVLPRDFHTWIFVGSNLGLTYKRDAKAMTTREAQREEAQNYHNVYLDPAAYAYYVKNREFPDPTILVMDVYEAAKKEGPDSIVHKGSFNGKRVDIEVAVKNKNRPDRIKDPDRTKESVADWAYYFFPAAQPGEQQQLEASPRPDSACHDCHKAHASKDNVWVQFYPILRDLPPKP
jgi:Cytochrome P460